MTTATTTTFREFTRGDGTFMMLNTDYVDYCRLSGMDDEIVRTAHLSRDTARELGTNLIAWTGNDLTSTLEPVAFSTEASDRATMYDVMVDVLDGQATLMIGTIEFRFDDEEIVDLAQRLIVWAGVEIASVDVS